jgi:ABC-type lipoprotein export system ATPase subunit
MQLELVEITHRYGERTLFEGITTTICAGTVVGVVGPSGSGKSTLLAIMAGLLQPTRGTVTLRSNGLARTIDPRYTCWVPQGSNAFGSRTVLDNAAVGALAHGEHRRRAKELALDALRSVGLGEFTARTAQTLSGGELQRLAIARALCTGQPLLFADEPTGSLDRTNTLHIIEILSAVASGRQLTIIVATHDPLVAEHCDFLIRLDSPS